MALQHLPEDTKASYEDAKKALKERFEPESRKDRYKAEFQARRKKRTEGWPDYAEDLKILVDKAYPDLEPAARVQMALTHYLAQIDNTQVSFSVKQRKPTTLDDAVTATLEMESYLGPKVELAGVGEETVAAVAQGDSTGTVMKELLERMERLESELTATQKYRAEAQPRNWRGKNLRFDSRAGERRSVTCWQCGKKGHTYRDCWDRPASGNDHQAPENRLPYYQYKHPMQGNDRPSAYRLRERKTRLQAITLLFHQ